MCVCMYMLWILLFRILLEISVIMYRDIDFHLRSVSIFKIYLAIQEINSLILIKNEWQKYTFIQHKHLLQSKNLLDLARIFTVL